MEEKLEDPRVALGGLDTAFKISLSAGGGLYSLQWLKSCKQGRFYTQYLSGKMLELLIPVPWLCLRAGKVPLHWLAVVKNPQWSTHWGNISHLVLALFGNKDRGMEEGGTIHLKSGTQRERRVHGHSVKHHSTLRGPTPGGSPRHITSSSASCPLGPPTTIIVSLVLATILVLG